jgi:hypothetical protein
VSYRPSAAGAEDYDLWLRLSATRGGGVANLPCVVTHHRRHNGNATLKLRLRDADVAAAPTEAAVAGPPAAGELGASGLDERGNGGGREGDSSGGKGSSDGEGIDDSGPAILSPAEAAAEWAAGAGERSSSSSGSSSGGEEREFSPRAGLAVGAFTAAAVEAPNAATAAAAAAAAAAALGPLAERGKSAALRVAAAHMAAALAEGAAARRRGRVSLRAAACARDPAGSVAWGATPADFAAALALMLALEAAALAAPSGAATGPQAQATPAAESPWARAALAADCTARVGELALVAMATHGSAAAEVWKAWASRAGPEAQVAALRGLLGSSGKSCM